jgi:hypothetical protein
MTWPAMLVLSWVLLALDHGLRGLLMLGESGPRPSLIFALVVAIGLAAPAPTATWAALALGATVDLLDQATTRSGELRTILGPNALGYLAAMQFILAMRPLMNKRNPLSFGFLALTGSIISGVIVVILYTFRTIYNDPIVWHAKHELLVTLGSAVYSGVIAVLLSLALIPLSGFLGLPQQGQQRRFSKRS